MKNVLTYERLAEVLDYNWKTGKFRYNIRRGRQQAGTIAGTMKDSGYIRIEIDGVPYYAQCLAWFFMVGDMPTGDVDHKNHNRADNRWDNLREVTHRENQHNHRPTNRKSFSGLLGAVKAGDKFAATISVDGKAIHLGTFDCEFDAHAAYNEAKKTYHPTAPGDEKCLECRT